MKKICASLAVASALFIANANAGMVIDVEGGTGLWYAETTGNMNTAGDASIDLKNDLGLEESSNGYYYLDVNHFVPIIPNVRLEGQKYSVDGSKTTNVTFKGQTFNSTTNTDLKLDQTDLILYWGVPGLKTLSLGHVAVDFGIDIKKFDGYAKLTDGTNNENVNIDFTVPMGYLAASVKVPFINTKVSASTKMISYKSSSLNESMVKASFKLPIPIPAIDIKAEVGYKTQNLELDPKLSDDINVDIKNSGMFVGIAAKF